MQIVRPVAKPRVEWLGTAKQDGHPEPRHPLPAITRTSFRPRGDAKYRPGNVHIREDAPGQIRAMS